MNSINTSNIAEFLKEHDIRPSAQRIAVMRYLIENRTHPTAEEIQIELSADYPTLSKTTVYNTLWLLAEKGAADVLTIDRTNVRFDYPGEPHAHFLCTRCNAIHDIYVTDTPVPAEANEIGEVNAVSVYYKGICRKCRNKLSVNNGIN